MSVTAHSPYLGHGHKRLLSECDSPEHRGSLSPKRLRTFSGSPPATCSRPSRDRSYTFGSTTLAAIRSLFPHMDEKTVVDVLDACGEDINEAIKRLSNLQLTKENLAASSRSNGPTPPFPSPVRTPSPRSQGEAGAAAAGPSSNEAAAAEPEVASKTPAQWVDTMVQQMAEAKDVSEARVRAAHVFRAFEQAVIQAGAKQGRQGEAAALSARVAELLKENSLLKRAVAIQQTRWQEAVSQRDQQASQMQEVVSQLQAKVHSLEVSNYSLALHLRQATTTMHPDGPHPDVF